MKPSAVSSLDAESDFNQLLTLREASQITGMPREYLEECIASRKLAVHLFQKGDVTKFRVTRATLANAGMLESNVESPESVSEQSLEALIQSQAIRLAAIEEQRVQLAAQLGVVLERNRDLEARLHSTSAGNSVDELVDQLDDSTFSDRQATPNNDQAAASDSTHVDALNQPALVETAPHVVRSKPDLARSTRMRGAISRAYSMLSRKKSSSSS